MGLEILQAIQRFSHPALDVLFTLFTLLGEKTILAGVFCAIYWCFDKRMGRYLMLALCSSTCLNGILKDTFQFTRPIGEEGVVSKWVNSATGHSFPSGHAQSSATFWWGAALWLRKRWIKALALLLILGVAFSRLYLGVHYPADVLVGAALGLLVSSVVFYLFQKSFIHLLYLAAGLLALGCLLFGSSEDTFAAGIMTFAVFAGIFFEEKFVRFQNTRNIRKKLLRLALGGALMGILYLTPKLLFPGSAQADALGVGLVAFAAMGPYPLLFSKMRL